jgi:hypothetical protein
MDNVWLEFQLMAAEDTCTDQRTLVIEKAKEVGEVKVALQEKEGVLAMMNGELQRACDALAKA